LAQKQPSFKESVTAHWMRSRPSRRKAGRDGGKFGAEDDRGLSYKPKFKTSCAARGNSKH